MADNQNWDMLITHATVATLADGYGLMRDAAIAIQNAAIVWLGSKDQLPTHRAKKTYDAAGKLITPGLIDCHTHLVYAGNRAEEFEARLNGKTYVEIAAAGGGILSTVRATRTASEAELFTQSEKRLQSLMAEGVTTIEIKSGYGLDTGTELKMLRVARALCKKHGITVKTTFLGAHALPPEFTDKDAYIDYVCEKMLPAVAHSDLADAVDGFCEHIGFTPAHIARVFDAAKRHGLPVKLHAEQLSDQGGAALAAQHNALSADHLEYLNEASVKAMANAGTVAVLLPGAFYVLHETQKPPMDSLRTHNVPIALATDCNPGTSPITSILTVMNMGATLFDMTPEECLRGVTLNAAKALGLSETHGSIAVGKRADLAIWDVAHPAELTYYLGYNPCAGVVRGGVFYP